MLYDEKIMLELCEQLGIEVVDGSGRSQVNGVEITSDDIDGLFDFPIYEMDTHNETTTHTNYIQTFFNVNDISNIEVLIPQITIKKRIYDFCVLKNDLSCNYIKDKENNIDIDLNLEKNLNLVKDVILESYAA